MPFEDKTITCADCGAEFVHSADDQARYAERGFKHEPKRCRECREKRKAQGGGAGSAVESGVEAAPDDRPPRMSGVGRGPRGAGGGGPRRGGGAPREAHEAVCAECGAKTTVPFKPSQGRPVYCRDCYRAKRR